ncbi:ASST-domain-containing protein [Xylariales sp. PMI_506]|nr:ASST-domain-containing protein [Xylariales sp. PMI_506]
MRGYSIQFLACLTVALGTAEADEFKYDYDGYNNARYGIYPSNNPKGTEGTTPVLQINAWDKAAMSNSGSHIFLRHNSDPETKGNQKASPLILDANDLTAVYINHTFPVVFNVRVQENFGQKYLTFYGDKLVDYGLGDGLCHMYDTSYREVYTIGAQSLDVGADLHECELTGHGTVIVSAYEPSHHTKGQRSASIRDSIFQEINLETKEVLFIWRASEHVDIYDSYVKQGKLWDFFHINSVEKTEGGDYLVSARHMHSIYLVDGKTGEIKWTLGGHKNEFVELQPDEDVYFSNPVLTFSWQHHARFLPSYLSGKKNNSGEAEITFFDNNSNVRNEAGCTNDCSRGLRIRLDTESIPKTVQLIQEYQHPAGLLSQSQGSVQVLDNGNFFIGWGSNPSFTEHTPDGEAVMDVQFAPWRSSKTNDHSLDNYRAYKQDWDATPYWCPYITTTTIDGVTTAYVSWNGATGVKSWVIHGSDIITELKTDNKPLAQFPRSGFETAFTLHNMTVSYLRATAMDHMDRVIGSTVIIDAKSGEVVSTETAVSIVINEWDDTGDIRYYVPNLATFDFAEEGEEWDITITTL